MAEYSGPLFRDDNDGYKIEDELLPVPATGAEAGELVSLDFIPAFQSFSASNEQQLAYLLLIIRTGVTHQNLRNPLNVCLVIDQSSSMRGEKLFSVKSAAKRVVDQLTSNDYFTLISFNDRATIVVNCQKVVSRETIKSQIDLIDAKGGTELAQGLFSGINEMKPAAGMTDLNYLLLLTDGQTYGDAERCVHLGNEAARHKIVIHPMGIGADWNEDLLETVAARSGGSSEYIETADQIVKVFMQKISQFRATLANDATLIYRPVPGAKIRQVHRTSPNIGDLELTTDPNTSMGVVMLGPLGMSTEYKLLIETLVPPCPAGAYRMADISLNYSETEGRHEKHAVNLAIGFNFIEPSKPTAVNSEVKTLIEKISAFKLQARAWQDIANGDIESGTKRLSAVGSRLLSMGEVDLAAQVKAEVQNLEQRGTTSAEGKKRIKYGTRGLTGSIE